MREMHNEVENKVRAVRYGRLLYSPAPSLGALGPSLDRLLVVSRGPGEEPEQLIARYPFQSTTVRRATRQGRGNCWATAKGAGVWQRNNTEDPTTI